MDRLSQRCGSPTPVFAAAGVSGTRAKRLGSMLGLRTFVFAVALIAGVLGPATRGLAGTARDTTVKSPAWAGYQANGSTFRTVSASWTVPVLTCLGTTAAGDADSYFWAGLGSGGSNSEQLGVREFCTGTLPAYIAYLGMNGLYEAQAIDPMPGDQITASVSYANGKFRFALSDPTQQKAFSLLYRCGAFSFGQGRCSRSTAEIIAGIAAPGLSPLADYGAVQFHNVSVTAGKRGSFAKTKHWKVTKIREYDGSSLAASPSSLSHSGTQFTDVWSHF
jgi:Peptidase A4 family